jgi:hypothetical protein
VRQAIDGARALMPLLEQRHAQQLGPVRDTLSQLQLIYAQQSSGAPPAGPGEQPEPAAGEPPPAPGAGPGGPGQEGPGPAQRSGRLWIPGQ